ncbi:IS110 family transposase [Romboutsia sp.]|uniref:IS110 family transposase n=1 Tax=Romboutsia sp. TaxID=1965302 RepID=UPI003F38824A
MSKYINNPVIGIDVAAEFSIVAILAPNGEIYRKSFRINHTLEGFRYLALEIEKVEKKFSMKAGTFMESTGVYHLSLFHFLCNKMFDVFTINPLITNSNKNSDIRKVKNDKKDALSIAKICKYQDIKFSSKFDTTLYTLKSLCREYYKLTDTKSIYKKKLSNDLRLIFPGYTDIFSDITSKTSIQILKTYPMPKDILFADKDDLINILLTKSRKGIIYAEDKYSKLISTSESAKIIGIPSPSLFVKLISDINIIENFETQIKLILLEIQNLLSSSQIPQSIVDNIDLLKSIPGIGELTAITIISEIGDIKNFTKSKHLVAFFGIDPSVNESGKFKGNNNHISKRGTRIGRRALYAVALASIRCKRNGDPTNSVLLDYYKNNMSGKSKKVGLVAIMHKLMKYIFSVLRSQNPYELRMPLEHCKAYIENVNLKVA